MVKPKDQIIQYARFIPNNNNVTYFYLTVYIHVFMHEHTCTCISLQAFIRKFSPILSTLGFTLFMLSQTMQEIRKIRSVYYLTDLHHIMLNLVGEKHLNMVLTFVLKLKKKKCFNLVKQDLVEIISQYLNSFGGDFQLLKLTSLANQYLF